MGTSKKKSTESFVKDIRKNTRRIFTAEQKILEEVNKELESFGDRNN